MPQRRERADGGHEAEQQQRHHCREPEGRDEAARLGPAIGPGAIAEDQRRGDEDALIGGRAEQLQRAMRRDRLIPGDPIEMQRGIDRLQQRIDRAVCVGGKWIGCGCAEQRDADEQPHRLAQIAGDALCCGARGAEHEARHGEEDEDAGKAPGNGRARVDRHACVKQQGHDTRNAERQPDGDPAPVDQPALRRAARVRRRLDGEEGSGRDRHAHTPENADDIDRRRLKVRSGPLPTMP